MNDERPMAEHFPGMNSSLTFEEFMSNYQDMVYTTAARILANDAQAEDIAQEVFIKAYERFEDLQDSPSAGGWLKAVARNLSLNHLSRYRRRWRFFSELSRAGDGGEQGAELDPSDLECGADLPDAADRREWVDACLRQLSEAQRLPLVLYHFEELSYDEIAKQLGVSLSKVKTDIHRARRALAGIMNRTPGMREVLDHGA